MILRRSAPLVALFAFLAYIVSAQLYVSEEDGLSSPEEGCEPGTCEGIYVEELRAIEPIFAERVESFLCPFRWNGKTSDKQIIVAPGPATTGTRSFAQFLGEGCGIVTAHFRSLYCLCRRYEETFYWGLVNDHQPPGSDLRVYGVDTDAYIEERSAFASLGNTMTEQEVDAFFMEDDLVEHLVRLRNGPWPGQILEPLAFADAPVDKLFVDLFHAFPNALFVLLERDPDEWFLSRSKYAGSNIPVLRGSGHWTFERYGQDVATRAFNAIHAYIRCKVPPERLLRVNYFEGDANCTGYRVESAIAEFIQSHNETYKCNVERPEMCV